MVKQIFLASLIAITLPFIQLPSRADGVKQVIVGTLDGAVYPLTVIPGMELQIDVSSLSGDPISQVTWGNTQLIGCQMIEVNKVVKAIRILALSRSGQTNLTIWTMRGSFNFIVTVKPTGNAPFVIELLPSPVAMPKEKVLAVSENTQHLIIGLASESQKPKLPIFFSALGAKGLTTAIKESGLSMTEVKALYDKAMGKL
jgi:hypothetical protein